MGRWYRRGLATTAAAGLVALAVAAVATAASGDGTSQAAAPTASPASAYDAHVTFTVGAVDNDTSPQELWGARGPASYRYVWVASAMIGTSQMMVEVRDRRVVSQVSLEGPTIGPSFGSGVAPTIDEVFARIRAAQEQADLVQITYDAAWGYPSSVRVDGNLAAVDDEYAFGVEALQPL